MGNRNVMHCRLPACLPARLKHPWLMLSVPLRALRNPGRDEPGFKGWRRKFKSGPQLVFNLSCDS